MSRKILAVLSVLLILSLGGCQLANENDAAASGKDSLCGIFITTEPLDFGSAEETVEVPPNWNGNPSDIIFPEQRIYATKKTTDISDFESWDYTFDNTKGLRFIMPTVIVDNENYRPNMIDNGIEDVHIEISDQGTHLSGKMYIDVHYPCHIYANPVYQTPDGDVYMIQGDGLFMDEMQTEGSSGSTTLTATTKENLNGEIVTRSMTAEIKIEAINTNLSVVLKQMDSNDQIIEQTDMTQENIPDSIRVLADTAYMILEEHCVDYENNAVVKRTLLKTEESTFIARFTGDNGFVQGHFITLVTGSDKGNS